jgi:chromosome segregation ATPase
VSRWKALAAAHDVADADLRDRLVDALETLHVVSRALKTDEIDESALLEGVADLHRDLESMTEERNDAQNDASATASEAKDASQRSDRLEAEVADLKDQIKRVEVERDNLQARLDTAAPLLDAYSDLLARARTFVTLAEKSGVKTRHARPVAGTGAPTKDRATVRRNGRKKF